MTGWKAATKGTSCFYSISSYEERQKPHLFIHSLSLSLSLSLRVSAYPFAYTVEFGHD